jgi:hypothetical protein
VKRALALTCTLACSTPEPAAPLSLGAPPTEAAAASAPSAAAGATAGAAKTLDGSTGGPLKRIALTSVRMTEDVLHEGTDEIASHVVECDPSFGSLLGTHWYAFGDDECYQGASVSAVQLLHNGRDGLGCTVRWLGTLKTPFPDPFAGLGHDITRAQLSSFKAIRLEIRGDGRRYRAQFPMEEQLRQGAVARTDAPRDAEGKLDCHEEWFDFYGQDLVCGDGTDVWAPLTLNLAALKQVGFGKALPLVVDDVKSLQIVTVDHDAHDFQCEVRVVGLE